ncbi:MAG: hypothetical protein EOL87_14795 [Spartobacteria bacterium]|nr:hypothetical protein [Spartobacteria bacterium]
MNRTEIKYYEVKGENALNLNQAAKKDEVVRLADPFQSGAGNMAYGVKDEAYVTHRGMKQHRVIQGQRRQPGLQSILDRYKKYRSSTDMQCKKRYPEDDFASDGLRFSDEAINSRGVKRFTVNGSYDRGTDIMQRMFYQ